MNSKQKEAYIYLRDKAKNYVNQIKMGQAQRSLTRKQLQKLLLTVVDDVGEQTYIWGHCKQYDALKDLCWKHILNERSTKVCEEQLEV